MVHIPSASSGSQRSPTVRRSPRSQVRSWRNGLACRTLIRPPWPVAATRDENRVCPAKLGSRCSRARWYGRFSFHDEVVCSVRRSLSLTPRRSSDLRAAAFGGRPRPGADGRPRVGWSSSPARGGPPSPGAKSAGLPVRLARMSSCPALLTDRAAVAATGRANRLITAVRLPVRPRPRRHPAGGADHQPLGSVRAAAGGRAWRGRAAGGPAPEAQARPAWRPQ